MHLYSSVKENTSLFHFSNTASRWLNGKESACQCRSRRSCEFDPWVGTIPCRRKWQPTSGSLPGKSLAPVHRVTKSQAQLSTHTCTWNLYFPELIQLKGTCVHYSKICFPLIFYYLLSHYFHCPSYFVYIFLGIYRECLLWSHLFLFINKRCCLCNGILLAASHVHGLILSTVPGRHHRMPLLPWCEGVSLPCWVCLVMYISD